MCMCMCAHACVFVCVRVHVCVTVCACACDLQCSKMHSDAKLATTYNVHEFFIVMPCMYMCVPFVINNTLCNI